MIKLFVKDKRDGYVHEIGTSVHDSLVLTEDGTLFYYNLQNGESSESYSDYEFVNEDGSKIDEEYMGFVWSGRENEQ